ncbi:MAG TPA: hypothetical protein VFI90_08090 [Rubrobacter sp.]|nr:hypothetical protein [Rubrobacter sp.]
MSLTTAVQAEPWMPLMITYTVTATVPMIAATVEEIAPYEASETMSPNPWNCKAR